jgi:hypothetical protein
VHNVLSNNQVCKQLFGNYAASGMLDKMKIGLQFSKNQIDSKVDKSHLNQKQPDSLSQKVVVMEYMEKQECL